MAKGITAQKVDSLVLAINGLLLLVTSQWLAAVNLAAGLYVGLAFLAPYLAASGHPLPAGVIYRIYSFLCHQRPSRSFFIFGEQVAICQRDVAIYGGLLLGGLIFALVRQRAKPLPWKAYLALNLLLALDFLTQFMGLRESNWPLRTVTGGLFGISTIWLAYPYVEEGMQEAQAVAREALLSMKGK